MEAFATWFISIAGTVAGRVLMALGMGWVTFEGYSAVVDQLSTAVQSAVDSLPAGVLAILQMSNVLAGIGIILGAYVAKAGLMGFARLGRVTPQ